MTVLSPPLMMNSIIEETPTRKSQSHDSSLYRTNTFPRLRSKRWRRSVSTQPDITSAAAVSPPYSPTEDTPSPSASKVGSSDTLPSIKGFKRGFSEQFYRLGRGTLERIGRSNRARRLAGWSS